jgi:hypothetical protein
LFETLLVFLDPHIDSVFGGGHLYTLAANTILATVLYPVHGKAEQLLKKKFRKKGRKEMIRRIEKIN